VKITALCPTYRHPTLLAESLELWNRQSYPLADRTLIICDDGGTFHSQAGEGWGLVAASPRFPSLPAKYNYLLSLAPPDTDAFLVWEDDDVYLPDYITKHVECLQNHDLSKPSVILTDYTGTVRAETGHGRFHSSLAIRKSLMERVGGWPDTKRADFDLQMIQRLQSAALSQGTPWTTAMRCQYVMAWHTGAAHGQWCHHSGPGDELWYDRAEQIYQPVDHVGELVPGLTARVENILRQCGVPCDAEAT
jgi:hypothetical protein